MSTTCWLVSWITRYLHLIDEARQANWSYTFAETPERQRHRLIGEFLALKEIPKTWYSRQRVPRFDEIETIFRPWRSDDLRQKASKIWHPSGSGGPILLRTYYDPDDDPIMRIWVRAEPLFCNEAWWSCLDNANLFNFGPDWKHVYEILPELSGPTMQDGDLTIRHKRLPHNAFFLRENFKSILRKRKDLFPDEWREDKHNMIYDAASELQYYGLCEMCIILADRQAFETGCPLLLFMDSARNIIRHARFMMDRYSMREIITDWKERNRLPWLWEQSHIGERYLVDGDLGRDLYRLTEDELA